MVKQYKIDEVDNLVAKLEERSNIIFTNYSGVTVRGLNELRSKLRENDAEYKVVKNNLFKRALEKAGYEGYDEYLKGPVGVAFVKEDVGNVAKILKDFAKEEEKFSYTVGILNQVIYTEDQIKQIADLPSQDVLIAQVMSLVNGPVSGIAMGMNQIMSSLARGIKAVAEANAQ